jgi:hypothetical protein
VWLPWRAALYPAISFSLSIQRCFMFPPISAERWAAIRALSEGNFPTSLLVGTACNINAGSIRKRAILEGWCKPDFRTRAGRAAWAGGVAQAMGQPVSAAVPEGWDAMADGERLAWLNGFVSRQVAQIAASAEGEGGVLDKARIDALSAMIRMLEKSGTFAEQRTEIQAQDDAELAAKLRLIDDRIVELAEALARRMVGAPDRGELG